MTVEVMLGDPLTTRRTFHQQRRIIYGNGGKFHSFERIEDLLPAPLRDNLVLAPSNLTGMGGGGDRSGRELGSTSSRRIGC